MGEWTNYFHKMLARDVAFPILKPREKTCDDCAVKCGLYTEISIALKGEPEPIRRSVSEKWFCHDGGGACRGNWNMQRLA